MFYSQIILAKKGPLGMVWQAAHWGDKKLGRPAIFNTDISSTIDSIVHPAAPMALRVSGHLLLGVVRIYSRQVKFLLDDCQQAMVKVKMAYTAGEGGTGGTIDIAVTTRASNTTSKNALNISNFGEFTENADFTTTNFSIPLEEFLQQVDHDEQDWLPAELDESTLNLPDGAEQDHAHVSSTLDSAAQAADRTLDTEEWGVFDPFDGDEEDGGGGGGDKRKSSSSKRGEDNESTVSSEVEITRAAAANESLTSDPSALRRASVLQNESANDASVRGGSVSDTDFPMDGGEDLMGDDDDQQGMQDDEDSAANDRHRTSLRLSLSRDDSSRGDARISFGDEDSPTAATQASKTSSKTAEPIDTASKGKRRSASAAKKRRKRRKIVTDDGHTELSNERIRAMLADTSDIVRQDIVPPATWVPGQTAARSFVKSDTQLLFEHLTHEQLFCRPALGDDGQLAPELLALWARNCGPVLGKPFDYELVDDDKEESDIPKDEEDVDKARSGGGTDSVEDFPQADEDHEFPDADGGDNPFDDNDGGGIPFDDEEDRMPPQDNDDEVPMADSPAGNSQRSIESIFSLGATNGLDDVDFGNDDEDRDETTTTSKWHKNTLKVFDVLKKNLAPTDGSEHKEFVSYNELSAGVSRRTAAGFFFELLQLKTLNYIELNQDESYGDIKVSAGVKFMEDPLST